jgi:hypothetical protein
MGYLIELDPMPNALIHWPQPASAAAAVSPELNDDLEPIGTAKSIPPSRRRICGPQPRIEMETPLVPAAVAAAVCEEAGVWLGEPLPLWWRRVLVRRANAIYARNSNFRRKIRGRGTRGRDWLWTFSRHWLASLLLNHRPDLHERLPSSYSVGRPLPEKTCARMPNHRHRPGN